MDRISALATKSRPSHDQVKKDIGERTGAIYEAIAKNNKITVLELSTIINASESTIKRHIKKLNDSGYLIREGSDKTGNWKILK